MATRTREQRRADNIRNETQRRINEGDTSSYVQQQVRDNPGQFQNTVQSYQAAPKPEAKEVRTEYVDPISGRERYETMYSASPFTPGQFSGKGSQYPAGINWGMKEEPTLDPITGRERYESVPAWNTPTPWMDFGYGSVFGTSSGSTASSPAVQNSIRAMTEDLYNQGYSEPVAAQIAMEKMYPGWFGLFTRKRRYPSKFYGYT